MLRSALVLILLAFSASVSAQGLSYNFIQGAYGKVEVDDPSGDVDGNGFAIAGSFAIDQDFHIFGEYQNADLDFGVDVDMWEFGVGYHTDLSPNLDLIGQLGYMGLELDVSGSGSGDDDGFMAGLGLRGSVSETMELYGGLDYVDFDLVDSQTRATAGFALSLNEQIAIGLKASLWDDFNIFELNARYYFE